MATVNPLTRYTGDPAAFLHKHGKEFGLVLYERISRDLQQCERVDEAKQIRDKARAIEVYCAQALNHEQENFACKIRLRAERRAGELLRESKQKGERQKPGDAGRAKANKIPKSNGTTLDDLGISKQQSSDWQKLAAIPEKKFEEQLNKKNGQKPSTHELIHEPEPRTIKVSDDALFVHGRICDFKRHKCFDLDPQKLYSNMLDTMQIEIDGILPQLIPWLTKLNRKGQP